MVYTDCKGNIVSEFLRFITHVNWTQNYDAEHQRPGTKFYLFLIHLNHVLRLNSGQPSYSRYDWTCSLIFFSHRASQSHTGTRTVQYVNSFLLCNICAVSNNIKITVKKYILQMIQVLDGNVQNKKQG
jgi:hypothetical protein